MTTDGERMCLKANKMATFLKNFVSSLSQRWNISLNRLQLLIHAWNGKGPPSALAIAGCPSVLPTHHSNTSQFLDSIFDGILLAVPKHRRSLEKRLLRKHNYTNFMEHAMPKKNIVPCLDCGNFKEKGHICGHCYEKVRKETKEMQAKMGDDLEFSVPRSEMEFVYAGEKGTDGKFVVKMDKPRPNWFSRQLLNKTGL